MKIPLTEQDFVDAAQRLGIEVAVIKAVAEVESKNDGFLPNGEPVILFERHKFRKYTDRRFDISHPHLSNKKAGGYGKVSEQHKRLQEAVVLDRDAALRATSWGRFQILGDNWDELEYPTLQAFINAMYDSEAAQLDAFIRYVKVNNLARYLKNHNWEKFAAGYNGIQYKKYMYHIKLPQAYRKHKKHDDLQKSLV